MISVEEEQFRGVGMMNAIDFLDNCHVVEE
jgi:hypothetical protein